MLMLRSAELLPVATFCAREQQAVVRTLMLTHTDSAIGGDETRVSQQTPDGIRFQVLRPPAYASLASTFVQSSDQFTR